MNIPAMEAVSSARVGFLKNNNTYLLSLLYDNRTDDSNKINVGSDYFTRPQGVCVQAPEGMVVENFLNVGQNSSPVELSDKMKEEMSKMYRYLMGIEEEVSMDQDNIEKDVEKNFINALIKAINETGELPSDQKRVLQIVHHNSKQKRDVEIYENENRDFSDSDFSDVHEKYPIEINNVEDVDLWISEYDVEYEKNGEVISDKTASLWASVSKINGEKEDIPLVFYTSEGFRVPYSHISGHGDSPDQPTISDSFRTAIEDIITDEEISVEGISESEQKLYSILQEEDIEGTSTIEILKRGIES